MISGSCDTIATVFSGNAHEFTFPNITRPTRLHHAGLGTAEGWDRGFVTSASQNDKQISYPHCLAKKHTPKNLILDHCCPLGISCARQVSHVSIILQLRKPPKCGPHPHIHIYTITSFSFSFSFSFAEVSPRHRAQNNKPRYRRRSQSPL